MLLPAALLRTPALLIAILVSSGTIAHGQGLGEAAAKEKERRAKLRGSGESFSDSDLKDAGAKRAREGSPPARDGASPSPAASGPAIGKSPAAKDGGDASPVATTDEASDTATVEKAKRARGLDYKIRLDAVNIELKAAEERFKVAEREWSMVYGHSVGFPIEQATARLEIVRKDLARLKQQRDEIEEAARREGIPPGYMR